LYAYKEELEIMEAGMRSKMALLGPQSQAAAQGISQLRKKVLAGISDAFAFIANLAAKNAPDYYTEYTDKLATLLSNGITYGKSQQYTYMFTSNDAICFCTYYQLKDAVDESGMRVPELFIVFSMKVMENVAMNEYFVDVLHEFEPPSSSVMTSKVNPKDMKIVAAELSEILRVSKFANSINRIPFKLLIGDEKLTPDLFSYADDIQSVAVDTDTKQIDFWLKPTVTDKSRADDITRQLYMDVKGLLSSTRGKLRVAVSTKKNPKGSSCQVVSLFLIRPSGGPSASMEDLDFLKSRFGISDVGMNKILQAINRE
jgi:hypothetical protein